MALSSARFVLRTSTLRPMQALALRNYADEAAGGLALTFGSPTKSFLNNVSVSQVDVPSGSGNFSILPQHVPIIAVLRPGLMTIYKDGNAEKYLVSSGTITVNADSSAQILAEFADPLDNFCIDAARKNADAARQALASAADEEGKAVAQIEVDACEALINALEGK